MKLVWLCLISLILGLKGDTFLFTKPTYEIYKDRNLGSIFLYTKTLHPKHIIIFISGDDGWNSKMDNIVNEMIHDDDIIAGVDVNNCFSELVKDTTSLLYPSVYFSTLLDTLKLRYNLTDSVQKICAGYSAGATMVYCILAQSGSTIFDGGISLEFCSDIILNKKLPEGKGLFSKVLETNESYLLIPDKNLSVPWYAIHGNWDLICGSEKAKNFVGEIPTASFQKLRHTGHGLLYRKHCIKLFMQDCDKI